MSHPARQWQQWENLKTVKGHCKRSVLSVIANVTSAMTEIEQGQASGLTQEENLKNAVHFVLSRCKQLTKFLTETCGVLLDTGKPVAPRRIS